MKNKIFVIPLIILVVIVSALSSFIGMKLAMSNNKTENIDIVSNKNGNNSDPRISKDDKDLKTEEDATKSSEVIVKRGDIQYKMTKNAYNQKYFKSIDEEKEALEREFKEIKLASNS